MTIDNSEAQKFLNTCFLSWINMNLVAKWFVVVCWKNKQDATFNISNSAFSKVGDKWLWQWYCFWFVDNSRLNIIDFPTLITLDKYIYVKNWSKSSLKWQITILNFAIHFFNVHEKGQIFEQENIYHLSIMAPFLDLSLFN